MNEDTSIKGYKTVNLADMIQELGEDMVKDILFDFSCPLNKDVEYSLHKKSIEFSKQSLSRTHLIFCSYKSETVLVAYFTLANKFIQIDKNALSKNNRKRITKFGNYDSNIKKYIISSPLIAQLGSLEVGDFLPLEVKKELKSLEIILFQYYYILFTLGIYSLTSHKPYDRITLSSEGCIIPNLDIGKGLGYRQKDGATHS